MFKLSMMWNDRRVWLMWKTQPIKREMTSHHLWIVSRQIKWINNVKVTLHTAQTPQTTRCTKNNTTTGCIENNKSTPCSFTSSSWTASTDLWLDCFFWATRFSISFFPYFFVSGPCARLSWPYRQLLSTRESTVSYRIVSYQQKANHDTRCRYSKHSILLQTDSPTDSSLLATKLIHDDITSIPTYLLYDQPHQCMSVN